MAVPPKRRNPPDPSIANLGLPTVPNQAMPTPTTYVAEQGVRPRVTIEIETMTKGDPKVTVRMDGDDPEETRQQALNLYLQTVLTLRNADEIERRARQQADLVTDPDYDPGTAA